MFQQQGGVRKGRRARSPARRSPARRSPAASSPAASSHSSLKQGDTFVSKSGNRYTLASAPKSASNGAMYARMTNGKTVFVKGASN